jgi:hypothetical protein
MTMPKAEILANLFSRMLAVLPKYALGRITTGNLCRAKWRLDRGFHSSSATKTTACEASIFLEQLLPTQDEKWLQFNPPRQVQEMQRIMIVGSVKDDEMVRISEFLNSCHIPVDLCSSLDAALNSVAQKSAIWRFLMVNVNPDQDLEALIDELSQFRVTVPNIPVVLVGPVFAQNDLSSERAAIADLTLCHPIRLSWLKNHLIIAEQNNAEWRARLPLDI